jgi:hypothetical protein
MKKLFFLVLAIVSLQLATFAQVKPAKPATKPATEKKAKAVKDSAGVVMKKDGTPDKRYKQQPAVTHTKKDGTPDKRYKQNKKKDKA